MQPWENDKNPNFGPNLGPQNFFFMSFTKLEKMAKNLVLGLILAPLTQI